MIYDIIIIGGGTAGMTAAIYGTRAGKSVLILEGETPGGQIVNAAHVENYPGFKSISGADFAFNLFDQAKGLGAVFAYEAVTAIGDNGDTKTVTTQQNTYTSKSIIIAAGAKNRPLGLEDEERLTGRGISYCATCDGNFFRDKVTAVVGGGNTALEDALFLSNVCKQVYLIHRRDSFRGEQHRVDLLREKQNITFLLNARVTKLFGEDQLHTIAIQQEETEKTLDIDGLFVAIGQIPQNQIFANLVDLDQGGYIIADEACRTKTKGIFAAGDCRAKTVRQLSTATADGTIAALSAAQVE